MKTVGILMIMIVLLAGCGTKEIPVTTTKTSGAPIWIDNEEFTPERITATGIARKNALNDTSMQRSEALLDGRTKILHKIAPYVAGKDGTLKQNQAAASVSSARKKADGRESASSRFEGSGQQNTGQVLYGVVPEEFWTDPANGTLYVLMVMSGETSAKAYAIAHPQAAEQELDQESRKLREGLQHMEETIEKRSRK